MRDSVGNAACRSDGVCLRAPYGPRRQALCHANEYAGRTAGRAQEKRAYLNFRHGVRPYRARRHGSKALQRHSSESGGLPPRRLGSPSWPSQRGRSPRHSSLPPLIDWPDSRACLAIVKAHLNRQTFLFLSYTLEPLDPIWRLSAYPRCPAALLEVARSSSRRLELDVSVQRGSSFPSNRRVG